MPRIRVVAAVVLALALMIASCSDSADQSETDVDKRQKQLEVAYNDGEKARQSIDHYKLDVDKGHCEAHYNATVGEDLGSDDMVDLGRYYFVKGCLHEPNATGVAQGP